MCSKSSHTGSSPRAAVAHTGSSSHAGKPCRLELPICLPCGWETMVLRTARLRKVACRLVGGGHLLVDRPTKKIPRIRGAAQEAGLSAGVRLRALAAPMPHHHQLRRGSPRPPRPPRRVTPPYNAQEASRAAVEDRRASLPCHGIKNGCICGRTSQWIKVVWTGRTPRRWRVPQQASAFVPPHRLLIRAGC